MSTAQDAALPGARSVVARTVRNGARGKRMLALTGALAALAWLGCSSGSAEPLPVLLGGAGGGSAGGDTGAGGGSGGGGGPDVCDAASCAGCCLPDGRCETGNDDAACGYDGYECTDCVLTARSCKRGICVNPARLPNGLVNDDVMFARDDAAVARMRRDLVRFIWGQGGFPTTQPTVVTEDVPNPEPGLTGFERVDELRIDMELGFASVAYLFHPPAADANGRLVVYHQGHSGSLGPNGGFTAINGLLAAGYAVLGVQMPLLGPNQGPVATHDEIIALASDSLGYDPIRFFVEPVAVALAYTRAHYDFIETSMTGISGGGWTTTLYAALDPLVRYALPTAGTLPLWLRVAGDKGDAEQTYESLYEIAGYPDLYVLGSAGAGRTHVQILDRYDSCCFAGLSYRQYEPAVAAGVSSLDEGSFRVFLDESHQSHQISPHAMAAVVLPVLAGGAVRYADDLDPPYGTFATVGSWSVFTGVGFGSTLQAAPSGNGDLRARWTVPVDPGTYRVSATWEPASNRATNATFTVMGDAAAPVNQQLAPSSLNDGGAAWEDLATGAAVAGDTLIVELSNLADGWVIADGIRVERLGS